MNLKVVNSIFIIVLLNSPSISAQAVKRNFDGGVILSIETIVDDNANRTEIAKDKLNELQSRYSAGVEAKYKSGFNEVDINYTATLQEFTQGSQRDDTSLAGSSSFYFDKPSSYFRLEASHDVSQVLNTPESDRITDNVRQQHIATVVPTIKTRSDKPSHFFLSGVYKRANFEGQERSDTVQKGLQSGWKTKNSKNIELSSFVGKNQITVVEDDDFDYDQARFGIGLDGRSRTILYHVQVGWEKITPKLSSEQSSSFNDIAIEYSNHGIKFNFSTTKQLTDTSFVGGGAELFDEVGTAGDLTINDQLLQRENQLGIQAQFFCESCDVEFNYREQKLRYFNFVTENSDLEELSLRFNYSLSQYSSTQFNISSRSLSFEDDASRDVEEQLVRASFSNQFFKNIRLMLYLARINRDQNEISYMSNKVGLTASWSY